jgi:hypothetical protein
MLRDACAAAVGAIEEEGEVVVGIILSMWMSVCSTVF